MKAVKIDTQTYQLGDYVIFKLERGGWRMGVPIHNESVYDMMVGGFKAYTVTTHKTLREAKAWFFMMKRVEKRKAMKNA